MRAASRRRSNLRVVAPDRASRSHAMRLLRDAITRVESGDTVGVVLLEIIGGDTTSYRLGHSEVPRRLELLGCIEEIKHQLLADHRGAQ